MIEITTGLLLVIVSGIGIVVCLVALLVTGPMFRKQRKELLTQIEEE